MATEFHPKDATLIASFPKGANPRSATFRLYRDESKRISTCHICGGPIPKGPRLIFIVKLPRTFTTALGGKIWEKRTFAHPTCILVDTGFMEIWDLIQRQQTTGERVPFFRNCWHCHTRILHEAMPKKVEYRVSVGRGRQYGFLCETCRADPAFERCAGCETYAKASETVRCWNEDLSGEFRACKGCAESLITVKEAREIQRFNDNLELHYAKLRERLREEHAPRAGN